MLPLLLAAGSVNAGDPTDLFVSTRDARYTIDVFRTGWYGGRGARPTRRDGGRTAPGPVVLLASAVATASVFRAWFRRRMG